VFGDENMHGSCPILDKSVSTQELEQTSDLRALIEAKQEKIYLVFTTLRKED